MLPIPIDRMSGRRSSSIGCRSILNRRASVYFSTPSHSERPPDPFKVRIYVHLNFFCQFSKQQLRLNNPNLTIGDIVQISFVIPVFIV